VPNRKRRIPIAARNSPIIILVGVGLISTSLKAVSAGLPHWGQKAVLNSVPHFLHLIIGLAAAFCAGEPQLGQ